MEKLVLFLFLLSSNLFADISGKVVDKNTIEPLANVNIRIKWTSIGTTTDNEGNFNIRLKEKEQYVLLVSMMGYKKKEIEVTNPEENVVIYLLPEMIKTPGVTVYGRKIAEEIEKSSLTTDELLSLPLIKPDPIHALQTLPGVSSPSDYFGWIFVRGGGGEENLYIWDGMELPTIYRFFGLVSIVNPFIIDKFELYPGGFSCRYGDKLSSVVTLQSRSFLEKTKLVFWSDPTEFCGLFESNLIKDIGFYLASRKSFVDIYASKLNIPEDVLIPYWNDFGGRLIYRYNKGEIFFQMLRGKDGANINLTFDSGALHEDTISLEWENLNETYGFLWTNSSELLGVQRLIVSKMNLRNKFLLENLEDNHQIEENSSVNISFSIEKKLVRGNLLECGFNLKKKREVLDVEFSSRETYLDIPAYTAVKGDTSSYVAGGYIENTSILLQKTKLRAGFRIDRLSITGESVISPRVYISYMPFEGFENYFSWGHYYQFPKFCFLQGKDLDAASAHHYIFGAKWNFGNEWFLKFDNYFKEYEKLIVLDSIVGYENTGYGYAYGFDLILRKHLFEKSFGWLSYSYTVSRRKAMDYPFLAPYTSDSKHTFNLVYSLQLPYRMQFGVRYRFNSGRPITPIYGRKWDGKVWKTYWGKFHSARYPHYSRLDLRIDKKVSLGGLDLNLYLTILNLLNRKNVQDYFFNDDKTKYRALYMLPIVPFIGIEGRF